MRKDSALGSHWPAIVLGLLIVVLFIAALVVDTSGRFGKAVVFTSAAVPTVVALGQYLYMKVDR
jgi:ABC-type phosphate transport system permease subunit